eukprot:COSAG05_NODE_1880_length_3909_cov_1.531234_3_plen_54_part_00
MNMCPDAAPTPSPRRSPRLAAADQLKAEVAALPMRRLSLANSSSSSGSRYVLV